MRRSSALLVLAALIAGCGPAPPAPGHLLVFAASSLKGAFTELAAESGAIDSGAAVEFSFAGSADLLAQLTAGARADVFATADAATMDRAAAAGMVSDPIPFATNTLTIAVAPGNPKGIRNLGDLSRVTVVACAPRVPCGAALVRAESASAVDVNPVSEENSVTDVLNKVLTGQADAGLVYVTDVRAAAGRVDEVPLHGSARAVNTYWIAVTRTATDPAAARRFVELLNGPAGREALNRAGFGPP